MWPEDRVVLLVYTTHCIGDMGFSENLKNDFGNFFVLMMTGAVKVFIVDKCLNIGVTWVQNMLTKFT